MPNVGTSPRSRRLRTLAAAPGRRALRGVGPALAEKLAKLGVCARSRTCCSCCRRATRTARASRRSAALRAGARAVVEGEIQLTRGRVPRPRVAAVPDRATAPASLTLRFFHFSARSRPALARGTRLRCFGEVRARPAGPRDRASRIPAHRSWTQPRPRPRRLTPIYPTTEGVQQGRLRQLIALALAQLRAAGSSTASSARCARRWSLPSLRAALRNVHRPPPDADLESLNAGRHPAQRRLAFEELLAHQLSLAACGAPSIAIRPGRSRRGGGAGRAVRCPRCRSR